MATDQNQRGPREMSERDVREHAWVDDWLRGRPAAGQWTPYQWKHHFFKLSTTLSYLLRHGAKAQGMTIRDDACIAVPDLLKHWQFKDYTEEEIKMAVDKNAKQRFGLKTEDGVLLINARQGHSRAVGDVDHSKLVKPLDISAVPDLVIHGTFWSNLKPILTDGLKKMTREHIHMAAGMDAKSGIRLESDTILEINVKQAILDGIKFMTSDNDVILTEGWDGVLPPEYIDRVMDRSGRTVPDQNLPNGMPLPAKSKPKSASAAASSSANGSAPSQPSTNRPAPSQLTKPEKDFLKVAKNVRGIQKIKELQAAGKMDKMQEKKLATWDEVLAELAEVEKSLSSDSDLRQKNADVIAYL